MTTCYSILIKDTYVQYLPGFKQSIQHYVNQAILLEKLDKLFGNRGKGLDILKSYLFNRYQYVKFGNVESTKCKISSGVPQSSVLDPFLFILYVNELPLASQFSTTLFADNTYLALADKKLSQLEHEVNYQFELMTNG